MGWRTWPPFGQLPAGKINGYDKAAAEERPNASASPEVLFDEKQMSDEEGDPNTGNLAREQRKQT